MAVNPEEVKARLQEAFNKVDKNNDGKISQKELKQVLQEAGFEGNDDNVKLIMQKADLSGDGKLDFEEFAGAVIAIGVYVRVMMFLRAAFSELDADGSGYITKEDLKGLIAKAGVGEKITEADLDALIKEADASGDGKISFEEFVAKMRDHIEAE